MKYIISYLEKEVNQYKNYKFEEQEKLDLFSNFINLYDIKINTIENYLNLKYSELIAKNSSAVGANISNFNFFMIFFSILSNSCFVYAKLEKAKNVFKGGKIISDSLQAMSKAAIPKSWKSFLSMILLDK